jgi:DNA polymerase elongation subunit (family B)
MEMRSPILLRVLTNGEVQITDLVISKLLRQNIEKYKALFPHVAAAIRLNVSGVVANRGDIIRYVHTDSSHADPLHRIKIFQLSSFHPKSMIEKNIWKYF